MRKCVLGDETCSYARRSGIESLIRRSLRGQISSGNAFVVFARLFIDIIDFTPYDDELPGKRGVLGRISGPYIIFLCYYRLVSIY